MTFPRQLPVITLAKTDMNILDKVVFLESRCLFFHYGYCDNKSYNNTGCIRMKMGNYCIV